MTNQSPRMKNLVWMCLERENLTSGVFSLHINPKKKRITNLQNMLCHGSYLLYIDPTSEVRNECMRTLQKPEEKMRQDCTFLY